MGPEELEIERTAHLTPANLKAVLEDLGAEPGWHASADLYGWFAEMCANNDAAPTSQRAFGAALKEMGYRSSVRRVDGKTARCWFITRRAWRVS